MSEAMEKYQLPFTGEQVEGLLNKVGEHEKSLADLKKDLENKAGSQEIPKNTSQLNNDSGFITSGDIPKSLPASDVHEWAKEAEKPTYTPQEVGADASGTAAGKVNEHNTSDSAHNDIRLMVEGLTTRLNALANSDDVTLDQMAEVVTYIKANRTLIESITTGKVSVTDIVNNLTTNVADKPLSAAQGVELKKLIDVIVVPTLLAQLGEDATHRLVTDTEKQAWNNKSNFSGDYNDLKNKPTIPEGADLTGYATEDFVKEYSQPKGNYLTEHQDLSDYAKKTEIPTVPVQSVNNKTGAVQLSASDVGARPSTWTPSASEVGADASGTAQEKVSEHNTAEDSHNDIRLLIQGLTTRLNTALNSTDTDLDQMAELVAYIKSNKSLIDGITTNKVNVADIIDNLTTSVSNKPLSAKQGVELKALIDALQNTVDGINVPTTLSELAGDSTHRTVTDAEKQAWNNKQPAGNYALQSDVQNLSEEIDDQQNQLNNKQPLGNYLTDVPDGYVTNEELEAEVSALKLKMGQLSLNFAEGETVEESLAWLEENGDTSQLYVLPDGFFYRYTETTVETEGGEPLFTNLANPKSTDWKADTRFSSSSGSQSAMTGAIVTNPILCTVGDIIRIYGIKGGTGSTANALFQMVGYTDTSGNTKGSSNGLFFEKTVAQNGNGVAEYVEVKDGITKHELFKSYISGDKAYEQNPNWSNVKSVRIGGVPVGSVDDIIITINEEIAYSTGSTQTVRAWVSTGKALVPADYEERIDTIEAEVENLKKGVTDSTAKPKWFALGDSIVEGYASSKNDDGTYNQFVTESANRWVNIVAEMNGYQLTNKGTGGMGYLQGTNNARILADKTDFSQCDFVTLAYGVNDWKYAVNIGSMADDITAGGSMVANMRYVIQKILSDNPYCKIFVITPINCRSYGTYDTNWGIGYKGGTTGALNGLGLQDIFDRMKEVCDYHGIEMIDMTHNSIVNRDNIRTMLADYVHPTVECHKMMARELAKKINFA